MRKFGWLLALGAVAILPHGAAGQVINEFVANHVGTDTNEYFEFYGLPSTDYSAYKIVEIEGEGVSAGLVDDAIASVGTTDANGIWVSPYFAAAQSPENGTLTLLLVTGFTGVPGVSDSDTNNDGVMDAAFWTAIVDSVGVNENTAGEFVYSSTSLDLTLPPSQAFPPGGASRIPNGTDTDSVSDWCRNDFDGAGIPGFPGTLVAPECLNTPGAVNVPEPASFALMLIGALVAARRRR